MSSTIERLRAQLRRLAKELQERQRQTEDALRRHLEQYESSTQEMSDATARHASTARALEGHMTDVTESWRRHSTRVEKFVRLSVPRSMLLEQEVMDRLSRMAGGTRPILVGPWTGEVGFELLYWIPFVRWFVERYGVDRSRLHVVSRGGPQSWYADLTARYTDALTYYSPAEFRARTAEANWAKQHQFQRFDHDILRHAVRQSGLHRPWLLHPSLMYRRFKGYWANRLPLRELMNLMVHRRPALPPAIPALPSRYVAVRFYFSTSFPDTPDNRAVVGETVRALTQHTDVVFLNTGFRVDDHEDFSPESASRFHTIEQLMTPERNLEVQSAVIGRADAFVGSYGGLSYLAPLYGVPSVALYSEPVFKASHLDLANAIYRDVIPGALLVLDAADRSLLTSALGRSAAGVAVRDRTMSSSLPS